MDLGAYVQINELEHYLTDNNIDIPRLRGLRLMREEQPLSDEELNDIIDSRKLLAYEEAFGARPRWSPQPVFYEWSTEVDRMAKRYLIYKKPDSDDVAELAGVKWHLVHGKMRKALKYAARKCVQSNKEQFALWNKYAGRDDVLYVHSRIGARWKNYKNEPWFLDGVCDAFDSTYCDIFVKIAAS